MRYEIQSLRLKDISYVSQLIDRSFKESATPTLTDEGIKTFKIAITLESIEKRLLSGNVFSICRNENTILDVGEIRNHNHLNLLFVEPCMQRKEIGRKLLVNLINGVTESEVTVNSSLNAVSAYKKIGFQVCGIENEKKGIKYQSMIYVKI